MFRLFHFHGIAYAAVGHLYVYKVADGGGDVGYVGRMVGLAVLHTPTHHQERYVGIVRIPYTVCRSFINFVAVYFIPSWLHDELDVTVALAAVAVYHLLLNIRRYGGGFHTVHVHGVSHILFTLEIFHDIVLYRAQLQSCLCYGIVVEHHVV